MRLDFSGTPEIALPQEKAWDLLLDPDFVAATAPGVESVDHIDKTHFKVTAGLGVGAIKLRFHLDVELSDLERPTSARMTAKGKAPGSNVHVDTRVTLDALAPDRTRLTWNAVADVHGAVASVGARLLKGTARKLTEEFWEQFAARASAAAG